MSFDYGHAQELCDRQIKRFGQNALLRRASGDRKCVVAFTSIFARDTDGKLINPLSIIVIMSAAGGVEPDYQEDSLITLNQKTSAELFMHRLTAPCTKLAPGGTAVYWELKVQQNGRPR